MKRELVETKSFFQDLSGLLSNEEYRRFQWHLANNPESGEVIPGAGGLRKIRWSDPSRAKGQRGGCRIIYLDVPGANTLLLVAVYGKNEKDDLSQDELELLSKLASSFRASILHRIKRK